MKNEPQTKRKFDRELVSLLKMRGLRAKHAQIDWQHDPDVIMWCVTHTEHWQRLVVTYGNNYARPRYNERR